MTSFTEEGVSLRDVLVRTTADLHAKLDRGLGLALVDRYALAAFLRASRSALCALEPALVARRLSTTEDAAARRQAIERDLEDLGAPLLFEASPMAARTPVTTAEAYGCAYVVEGSSLGGLALARMLGPRLGLHGRANRYLTFRGAETMTKWRAFLGELEAFGARASEQERGAACSHARSTFELFARAFELEGLLQWSK